jgi:DNA-binding GntR family transcriptional regulator
VTTVEDDLPLIDPPSLGAQVYERLRHQLLAGDLRSGDSLSVAELAKRFSVSAMPIRDALKMLEQDGLVETSPRRRTRVVQVEPTELLELVPLLSTLEQFALVSASDLDMSLLGDLEQAMEDFGRAATRGDAAAASEADVVFHGILIRMMRNASLERILRNAKTRIMFIRIQVLRPRISPGVDPQLVAAMLASHGDHVAIVAALRGDDRAGAAAALGQNWSRSLLRFIQGQGE